MPKVSVSLTDEHARVVHEAVESGDYASSSEVIREALREWRARRTLGRLSDEGLVSGTAQPETLEALRQAARLVRSPGFAKEARRQSPLVDVASPHERRPPSASSACHLSVVLDESLKRGEPLDHVGGKRLRRQAASRRHRLQD